MKLLKNKCPKSLEHGVLTSGLPAKYSPRPTGLDFGDRTRTGTFPLVWSETRETLESLLNKAFSPSQNQCFYSSCDLAVNPCHSVNTTSYGLASFQPLSMVNRGQNIILLIKISRGNRKPTNTWHSKGKRL